MDIPQYSDILIKFTSITYNLSISEVDLSTVDDVIVSIAKFSPSATPLLILKNSTTPAKFTIDNTAKSVEVKILSSSLGTVPGKYYVNLWIKQNSEYVTHLTESFNIVETVKYSS